MILNEEVEQLFQDTKRAFECAPINKYAPEHGLKWYYSISATKLTSNANVIVGFNWGLEGKYKYQPQTTIPNDNFKDLYNKKWLGSFQRIYNPLKKYFPNEDVDDFVQTNFCFFRSKEENEITDSDLKLSTPLFSRLIEIIKPKKIIGFSNKLRNYFIENDLCSTISNANFASNNRTLIVAKGIFQIKKMETPIFFLPHPNSKFTTEAREQAWGYCFGLNK